MDVICENQMRESMGMYFENYAVLSKLKGPGMCLQHIIIISDFYLNTQIHYLDSPGSGSSETALPALTNPKLGDRSILRIQGE